MERALGGAWVPNKQLLLRKVWRVRGCVRRATVTVPQCRIIFSSIINDKDLVYSSEELHTHYWNTIRENVNLAEVNYAKKKKEMLPMIV